MSGESPDVTCSVALGDYTCTAQAEQSWTVEPQKSGGSVGAISALDAAWILQSTVGRRALDSFQEVACDTNGDGTVSPIDASQIVKLLMQRTASLPATSTCGSEWAFIPSPDSVPNQTSLDPELSGESCTHGSISYDPLSAMAGGQDFTAVLIGDCTGNWTPPTGTGSTVRPMTRGALRIGKPRHIGPNRIRVPLYLRGQASLQALEAEITTDSTRYRLQGIQWRRGFSGALAEAAENQPGVVTIVAANATPAMAADGFIASIDFEYHGAAPRNSDFRTRYVRVDEFVR